MILFAIGLSSDLKHFPEEWLTTLLSALGRLPERIVAKFKVRKNKSRK